MFYLYILYSEISEVYYVGISEKPFDRLIYHNTGDRLSFTSKHRPWEMVALFESGTHSEALKVERWIKKQKSRRLVEKIIDPNTSLTGELSDLVRVPHVRD